MKRPALDARLVRDLRRAATRRVLVALDFDGTLAPIVRRPSAAELPRTTRALLAEVALRYPTVVLTGRGRSDVRARLGGVRVAAVVGNHGLEASGVRRHARAQVRNWMPHLRDLPGLDVETKGESVSMHYRAARDRARARRLALRTIARLDPPPRVVAGKMVFNLLPDLGVDKGSALRALMRRMRVRRAIYVGDDITDEDVFALPLAAGVLGVRVGASGKTKARHRVSSQRQVNALLAELIAARPAGRARGRRP